MNGTCENCGNPKEYTFNMPIDDDLNQTWGLSKLLRDRFNLREGAICIHCQANKRAQGLARAIISSRFGYGANSLREWVAIANKKKLRVCELNACHQLHQTLLSLKGLTYAEYGTKTQQDIENLSYPDDSFDLVLHSETLEHVDNPKKAMNECRRVVDGDGIVLLTTPVIWSRKTRKRAEKNKGEIVKFLPASYHAQQTDDYLVYYEYGHDIDNIISTKVVYSDWRSQCYVFASEKKPQTTHLAIKLKFMLLESIPLRRS